MDVFISYSRRDRDVVWRLHDRLAADERDIWVDWDDIPPSAEWRAEIERGIEASDTFVCVLSPDFVASEMCRNEVEYAVRSHKGIMPVVVRDIDAHQVPPELARLNWLFVREADRFEDATAATGIALFVFFQTLWNVL